jgi:hypothetical protein
MMIESSFLLLEIVLLTGILIGTRPIVLMQDWSVLPVSVPLNPQLGPRLIWVMLVLCLLFWGTVVNYVQSALELSTVPLTAHHPLQLSVTSRFSLSSLPYRAYPLSCCLLD